MPTPKPSRLIAAMRLPGLFCAFWSSAMASAGVFMLKRPDPQAQAKAGVDRRMARALAAQASSARPGLFMALRG